jgi:hypothetical protein
MSTPHSLLFLLSELKKERIKEAFKNEEINHNRQEKSTPIFSPSGFISCSLNFEVFVIGVIVLPTPLLNVGAWQLQETMPGNPKSGLTSKPLLPLLLNRLEMQVFCLLSLNSPLILDANFDWNADTGATSHMTPHRHWFSSYAPHHVPIKLADNNMSIQLELDQLCLYPE